MSEPAVECQESLMFHWVGGSMHIGLVFAMAMRAHTISPLELTSSVTSSAIGLYRDVWIAAIASSTTSLATRTAAICVRFQGRRVRRAYVTMQITFLTRKSALIYRRGLCQRVASLTLNCNGDFAIRAYYASLCRYQYSAPAGCAIAIN